MTAIKDVYELEKAVNAYVNRHGMELKFTSLSPFGNFYNVRTMDYTEIESKIITMKNGKTRVLFKVDGKISSLYK